VRTTWPQRFVEGAALFLLVFTPLALGVVDPWSEAVVELVVLAMGVTYVIGTLCDWELRVELPPGWMPATLLLCLVVAQAIVPGWSADPHTTWRMALKLLGVAAFYLICWNVYRTRRQAQRAIWTMILIGTLVSVFGIIQRMAWNGHLYWVGREAPSSAFGPFVNRAHFAGLMVVIVPMTLAFVFTSQRPERRRTRRWRVSWGDRLREWNSQNANASSLVGFFALVMGGAALVSGSRGGVLALLTALAAMALGSLATERSWSGRAARVAFTAFLIVGVGAWISSEVFFGTIERLAIELGRPDDSWRVRLWQDALPLWSSAPLFGTGLGTFGVVFPGFRTIEAPVRFTHAESDWVQLLTDTGFIGFTLGLAVVVSIGFALGRRYREADSRTASIFALAGLVGLVDWVEPDLPRACRGPGSTRRPAPSGIGATVREHGRAHVRPPAPICGSEPALTDARGRSPQYPPQAFRSRERGIRP
jgi:O-antigen ligase